ncbi:TetR/AcrR family transcriptional regulator [Marinactinospora thermotolerans]|uniref:Transcriptional regulator, TetR family n=1 Tax=Marinactinospora thermotolerans DSM 45154 TaxID=1122192 RepID=A0A1T4N3A8_9ACTN|nr:TetR/AcrR family transcriptional regulator [Marinactinospora thermotolerans]SJZ73840.1 transcriptional regulator, TetR family [Marinactinospora thermotolerans DSM 45154]
MAAVIEWTPKARALLAAASELFYERGIHAVGVDAIAERAGVTKKTLYDRFGSKERLVVEYLSARDVQWRELLDGYLRAADGTPEARLEAVFAAAAEWARVRGSKGCAMINAHAEISDPAHPAYAVIVGHKRWMLALFAELVDEAGIAEPRRVAEHMLLLYEGALVTAGMGVVDDPFSRAATAALALLR